MRMLAIVVLSSIAIAAPAHARASHADPGMLGMFPTEVADATPAPIAAAMASAPAMLADSVGTQAAAPAPASGPSLISQALSFLGDHLGGVAGLLGIFLGLPVISNHLDAKRKREIALAVYHGFHIAADVDEELAPGGAKSTADKISAVLKNVDDFMKAQGWRPLKDGETTAATLLVKSVAGQAAVTAPSPAPAHP